MRNDFATDSIVVSAIERAMLLFENASPVPGVPSENMRMNFVLHPHTGKRIHYFVTVLRCIQTSYACGVHVTCPVKGDNPFCFFEGLSMNTFALPPEGGRQFFIEPDVDLSPSLAQEASFVSKDFEDGTCPPLVPGMVTVWTKKQRGAALSGAIQSYRYRNSGKK